MAYLFAVQHVCNMRLEELPRDSEEARAIIKQMEEADEAYRKLLPAEGDEDVDDQFAEQQEQQQDEEEAAALAEAPEEEEKAPLREKGEEEEVEAARLVMPPKRRLTGR